MTASAESSLKRKTAGTVKWNLIDRIGSQVLYAITGIVLANELTQEQFGLVGAVLVFQAFASLLVDSGFASALIQRKALTRLDYSSVLWFNLAVAVALYLLLWVCAPLIADVFQGDDRIIPLARLMFISLILNAGFIVQANILMKKMDVGKIAAANFIGLAAGGVVGIVLAVNGYGAWSIVWQTIVSSAVKTCVLWIVARWLPLMQFSMSSLMSFVPIASRMMLTSFLSTLFQNIYSLFVGNRVGMASLGYYTQSDKWSKMSITTLSQTMTASFIPALSAVQDEPERFCNMCYKFNRFAAYVVFPATVGLIVLATPIFHMLFGTKWDASIVLFQLLIFRGFFFVMTSLYSNFLLATGRAGVILRLEIVRDVTALVALFATLPFMGLEAVDNPVFGLEIMLWAQVAASVFTWIVALVMTIKSIELAAKTLLVDLLPYCAMSLLIAPIVLWIVSVCSHAWLAVCVGFLVAMALYLAINYLLGSKIQKDALQYIFNISRDN